MTDEDATDTTADPEEDPQTDGGETAGRDVVVPIRLYKTITVFSTLVAVVSVVFGFMFLDAATLNVSFLATIVTGLLGLVGITIADGILSVVFAAVGLSGIGFGAGVYVVGTRFRAEGMGKSQDDSDESSDTDG